MTYLYRFKEGGFLIFQRIRMVVLVIQVIPFRGGRDLQLRQKLKHKKTDETR